ncbi:MAG: hypothetical protein ACLFSF_07865, partial [Desulfonatronovibrio sp.]
TKSGRQGNQGVVQKLKTQGKIFNVNMISQGFKSVDSACNHSTHENQYNQNTAKEIVTLRIRAYSTFSSYAKE